jgi:beta-lactamase class A
MKTFVVLLFTALSLGAQTKPLQAALDATVAATFEKYSTLKQDELAITAIDLKEHGHPMTANYRGDARIYPASVIKLFYLEAAHRWMEEGKLKDGAELRRAMKDMIVLSYNEATHYVLDVLTDTTSGPELSAAEMEKWGEKRNAVNRYFVSRGYTNINANQKPWCEGPYGRDRIFVGENYTNRNALTTDATARLLMEIATEQAVSPPRCKQMLELLSRDPLPKKDDEESQVKGFTGAGLPAGAKLWSKAGWTSNTRHDAALIELPSGKKLILVTFTLNHGADETLIPFVAKTFLSRFEQ